MRRQCPPRRGALHHSVRHSLPSTRTSLLYSSTLPSLPGANASPLRPALTSCGAADLRGGEWFWAPSFLWGGILHQRLFSIGQEKSLYHPKC